MRVDRIFTWVVICFGFGIVALLGMEDIDKEAKLPIVVSFIFIAGYCLRRMPKEKSTKKMES